MYEEKIKATQAKTQPKHSGFPRWGQKSLSNGSGHTHEPGFTDTGFKHSNAEEELHLFLKRPAESRGQPHRGDYKTRSRRRTKGYSVQTMNGAGGIHQQIVESPTIGCDTVKEQGWEAE